MFFFVKQGRTHKAPTLADGKQIKRSKRTFLNLSILERYFFALGKSLRVFENTVEQRRRDIEVSRAVDAAEVVKPVVSERNKFDFGIAAVLAVTGHGNSRLAAWVGSKSEIVNRNDFTVQALHIFGGQFFAVVIAVIRHCSVVAYIGGNVKLERLAAALYFKCGKVVQIADKHKALAEFVGRVIDKPEIFVRNGIHNVRIVIHQIKFSVFFAADKIC